MTTGLAGFKGYEDEFNKYPVDDILILL